MKIQNPVLRGFHPDPSLVRAGEDYYIATSTFEWFPGVCIFHSRDMANWELVSHGLTDEQQMNLTGIDSACGIWAPNLTYDNGVFYLMYTIVYTNRSRYKDTYNYLITATDVRGPWSRPVLLNNSGYDPSLFHDVDGRKYLVNMIMDYRTVNDRFAGIVVQEYDPAAGRLVGEVHHIYRGSERGIAEGANIIRHGEYYYLTCAEGGTEFGHCAVVLRSRNIYGPYEDCPYNPILTSAGKPELALQRAGHMQIIEDAHGNWYGAHLCSRPVDNCSIMGRETAIQNITWTEDGWPRLSANDTASPEITYEVPDAVEEPRQTSVLYDFADDRVPLEFLTLRQSYESNGIAVRDHSLHITGGCSVVSKFHQGLLARTLEAPNADLTVAMRFAPRHVRHLAGLVVYYNYDNVYMLRQTREDGRCKLEVSGIINRDITDDAPVYLEEMPAVIYLRAEVREREVRFLYSMDDQTYMPVGEVHDMRNISDERIAGNGFTGAMLGVNCADLQGDGCEAVFDWIRYEEIAK